MANAKPVQEDKLHMTLVFLGMVTTAQQAHLINAAARLSGNRFMMEIDRSGWWKRPRILWLAPGQVPDALSVLQSELARLALACGVDIETRPYLPHITLAHKANTAVNIEFRPIHWRVHDFCLFESITRMGYVEYKIIQCWPLT